MQYLIPTVSQSLTTGKIPDWLFVAAMVTAVASLLGVPVCIYKKSWFGLMGYVVCWLTLAALISVTR